jgi:hypothetical protein
MGATWGVAWAVVGAVVAAATGFAADAPFPLVFGVLGGAAGVIFSVGLMLTDGRRRFEQLSLPRMAGWGAAGGLLLAASFARLASLGWGDLLVMAPTFALASAASAAGSLALARRAGGHVLPGGELATRPGELPDPARRRT